MPDDLTEYVVDRASRWYPELSGPVRGRLHPLAERPLCSLYVVQLSSRDGTTRRVLAKVRDQGAAGRREPPGRPRLRTDVVGPEELTCREYDGLRAIEAFASHQPAAFGAVRPLDLLPGRATLLMDFVEARTLRQAVLAESRLVPSWLPRIGGAGAHPAAWHNVGAWLRTYHDELPGNGVPARQEDRSSVVERFEAYGEYLAARLGEPGPGRIASAGAALAADVLPARLAVAVGHGDFAARNVFVDAQGRVSVFDPMPRCRAPRLEDLCRFVVGLRLLGLQVQTRGAAYGAADLTRREEALLAGYFADAAVARAELRCYQLLVVLDKWAALVDAAGRGSRSWLAGVRVANAYVAAEARRVLSEVEAPSVAR